MKESLNFIFLKKINHLISCTHFIKLKNYLMSYIYFLKTKIYIIFKKVKKVKHINYEMNLKKCNINYKFKIKNYFNVINTKCYISKLIV